jgi:hypothetical protein
MGTYMPIVKGIELAMLGMTVEAHSIFSVSWSMAGGSQKRTRKAPPSLSSTITPILRVLGPLAHYVKTSLKNWNGDIFPSMGVPYQKALNLHTSTTTPLRSSLSFWTKQTRGSFRTRISLSSASSAT